MLQRPRRNRKSATIRAMIAENHLHTDHLIYPLFLIEGENQQEEITSMPGIYRRSADLLMEEMSACLDLGIRTYAIFPSLPESAKDTMATESTNPEGLYLRTLRQIKQQLPQACIMTDVAMDPYSSDGHDGIVRNGEILNDETLEVLAQMAVAQAETGIDIIGPSDMMDGRIGYIREALDEAGYTQVSIMAYTAKYDSAFYGPFRDALDSAPKFGDKKTYQMDPANAREAELEADLDEAEGADFLMVKPALAYLDIIHRLAENTELPIAAYNVSGEYAMIKAAAKQGWLDGTQTMLESLMAIRRAGARAILTYFAKEFAELKCEG